MDFRFTEDQLELAEGARSFLEGVCTPDRLKALDEGTQTESLWSQIAEMGLLGLMAPEEAGGLGLGVVDFVLVAEAAGRVALPEPLVESAGVVGPLLAACDDTEAVTALVGGETRIAFTDQRSPYIDTFLLPDKIVAAKDGILALCNASKLKITQTDSIDPLKKLVAVEIPAEFSKTLASNNSAEMLRAAAFNRGGIFTAAQLLGLADGMISQATEYAQNREQFGVPIGTFQAVKHNLADAYVKLEFARPVVYRAAAVIDANAKDVDRFVSHAKLTAMTAAVFAAETAIQIHGAMGYTYEVPLHYWMKKTWALAGLWGDKSFHETRLENAILKSAAFEPGAQTFGR